MIKTVKDGILTIDNGPHKVTGLPMIDEFSHQSLMEKISHKKADIENATHDLSYLQDLLIYHGQEMQEQASQIAAEEGQRQADQLKEEAKNNHKDK